MPLIKIMFEDDHEHLLALRDYVSRQPWSADYEVFFSDRTLLEVTRKGASKGAMVARLAKRLGISMDHIYCAGDENNDLSMLTMAAEGFAPANCVETVRSCGATIVADCDHDTLAEIVSILERGESTLDESLALFEEGTKLAAACSKQLDQAEQKILKLTKGPDGEPVETPLKG